MTKRVMVEPSAAKSATSPDKAAASPAKAAASPSKAAMSSAKAAGSPAKATVAAPPRRATYQDVLDAPPNRVAEIVGGTLRTQPRPAAPHARASSGLGAKIGGPFDYDRDGPGGWWIIDEPELHLGDDIVVPDLAGWRRGRMPEYPDGAYFTLAPDWVCEVLSPSTRALDQGSKRSIYAREEVAHLWFVDPDARTLEVFELSDRRWVLVETLTGDAPVSLPPFGEISFRLGDLWPPATP